MAETPSLDDRRFQDLVDEARRMLDNRAPLVLGEDTATSVVEAAAFLADQVVYRLNQVPDRLHTALLDIVGVRPFAARPALVDLTFWLSQPVGDWELTVPARTQVTVPASSLTDPVTRPVFATTTELRLHAVGQPLLVRHRANQEPEPAVEPVRFSEPPAAGDALLFGFDRPAPSHAVALDLDVEVLGVGVDPSHPPLVWEAWDGDRWWYCEVVVDETGGLNRPGRLVLQVPGRHEVSVVCGQRAAWLRCRLTEPELGYPAYSTSPTIRAVKAHTVGGAVGAVHGRVVEEELLGHSTGSPGQCFRLREHPLVEPDDAVVVEVLEGETWEPWRTVPDFAASGVWDRHVVIDPRRGEVRFGPAIRESDGSVRSHGAVPPAGALVRVRNHMVGGGRAGNLPAGHLSVSTSPVPYVARVENRRAAFGGVDAETPDEAKARIPLVLRTRNRAVTADDYEFLAREVAPELARVRCLAGDEPASVRVLVVPALPTDDGRIELGSLRPDDGTLGRVASYLDERRVVGTRVLIEPPSYQGLTVVASLRARADPRALTERARRALFQHYHPLTGGPDGTGWPFGRPVVVWETYAVLQRLPGVDVVEDVRLFPTDPVTAQRGEPAQQVHLGPGSLAYLYEALVRVQRP